MWSSSLTDTSDWTSFMSPKLTGKRICRAIVGDAASFGFVLGEGPPIEGSYSQLLVEGKIANVIPDTSNDHRVLGFEQPRRPESAR